MRISSDSSYFHVETNLMGSFEKPLDKNKLYNIQLATMSLPNPNKRSKNELGLLGYLLHDFFSDMFVMLR